MAVSPQWPNRAPTPIAFVGEAPGAEEVVKGQPLVGPSGRVFNAMLRAANLERSDFLITNLFDEKAPENDVSEWLRDPDIYGPAMDRLAAELNEAQPTVIVPLGGTALWTFTEDASIMSVRGNVMEASRVAPGAKLLPTVHPAHVLRQWQFYLITIEDFNKAAYEAQRGSEIIYPKRQLLLEPTLQDLADYLPKLLESDLLSVDIETGWGQITCIGFAPNEREALCIPFVDRRRPNRSYWRTPEEEFKAWKYIQLVLESDVPKLGQNYGGYDAGWLLNRYGIRTMNMTDDTRLAHHALYPELKKDLAFLAGSYSNQGPWKKMISHKQDKKDN